VAKPAIQVRCLLACGIGGLSPTSPASSASFVCPGGTATRFDALWPSKQG
jgi:hypothetical protein